MTTFFQENLTIALIARNEAVMLPDFFKSHAFTPNVILYDDFSTDDTAAIAKAHGATVIPAITESSDFSFKRNIIHKKVTTRWVLWLDADERITAEALKDLEALLRSPAPPAGVRFRMQHYFLGKKMRGRHWRGWKGVRLAEVAASEWVGAVHEKLEVDGHVADVLPPLQHLGDVNYRERAEKSLRYNLLEIERMPEKPSFASVLMRPVVAMLRYYLLNFGFIDGKAGLIFALHVYTAFFQRYAMRYTESPLPKAR